MVESMHFYGYYTKKLYQMPFSFTVLYDTHTTYSYQYGNIITLSMCFYAYYLLPKKILPTAFFLLYYTLYLLHAYLLHKRMNKSLHTWLVHDYTQCNNNIYYKSLYMAGKERRKKERKPTDQKTTMATTTKQHQKHTQKSDNEYSKK